MAHQKRRVVDKVDYLTTPGWMVKKWPEGTMVRREELGMQGGPNCFISTLGIMKFNEEDKIMFLYQYYPGVTPMDVKANTGFDIDVSRATEAEPIFAEEIRLLREEIDPLNIYKMR
jgi:glutaconate CoA-transferase subunit B